MLKKLQVVAVLMCMLSYSAAGTVSIGTASARGDMRVDSYMVKGNATLFDGSVVETGQASANLRLDKGTQITMSTASRGTLYRDHLVLQRGESEMAASPSFKVEANGLRVTPTEPNSRGVVSLLAGNTVEVAVLNGSFGVTNDHGVLLASVRPGRTASFAMQASATPTSFSGVGMVSYEDGHYYLTDNTNLKFELTGKDFKNYVGTKVVVSGTVQTVTTPTGGTATVITVSSIAINAAVGMSATTAWIIGGIAVGGGVGLGVGVYEANQSSTPASR
jgi:hypothetical protein